MCVSLYKFFKSKAYLRNGDGGSHKVNIFDNESD